MEDGDLSGFAVPRLTIVLEGVLAVITTTTTGKRRNKVTTREVEWLETPLKQINDMKRRFPDTAIDVVTFISPDMAETASAFFDRVGIAVAMVYYADLKEWSWSLRFRYDVVTIYDSDPERLHIYGQKGVSVNKGAEF